MFNFVAIRCEREKAHLMCHAKSFENVREGRFVMAEVIHCGVDETTSLNGGEFWLLIL